MLTKKEILRIKQDLDESSDNSELIWHRDDINSLFKHIEQQQRQISELESEISVLKNVNNSI